MNGLTIMVGAMVIFFLGYRFYGRWLEKTWGIDPAALTRPGASTPQRSHRHNASTTATTSLRKTAGRFLRTSSLRLPARAR